MSASEQEKDQKINDLYETVEKMHTFIARRFDEISMEINATSQLIDMVESGAKENFENVMQMMQAVSASGGSSTSANTGLELEAILGQTEDAATTIMDAAEHIRKKVTVLMDEVNNAGLISWLDDIDATAQKILMACSFHDLVSQRVTKALENLQSVEDELNETFAKLGVEVENVKEKNVLLSENVGATQAEIDALFD